MNNLTAAQPAAQFQPSNGPNPQQYAAQSMPDHIPQQQQDQMSQFYATQPSMNGGQQQQYSNPTMRLPTGTLINQERNPANHTLVNVITPNISGGGAYGMPQLSMAGMMPQQQGYMQPAQYGWNNAGQYVTPTVQYVPGQQYMQQGYVPVQAPQPPFRQMHQMPPPMSQPQYIQQAPPQQPPPPPKKKKVLAIMDPESKQVINEAEVALTTDKSEKPSSTTPTPVGTTETAGNRFTKEVANQLFHKGSSPAQQVFETSGPTSVPSQPLTIEAPPAATGPPEPQVEAEAAKSVEPAVPSVVDSSQFPDQGPPPPPPEDIVEGIQNLSLDANGTDAKPVPPPALAMPEVEPPTAAEEQISEADESGAKEDGELDDKSATASVAGDESVQESSEELVRKMEEHMARFHDNPEVQAEFDANVYNRDFLYVLRNIVRELKLEKPAMPHSLEEVGLDRLGMPAPQQPMMGKQRRYEDRGGDKFTPSWQPRAQDNMRNMLHPRVPYGGRHSDNRQRQKKGPVGRPSMDRPQQRQADLLKRSENAWKPTRRISKMDSVAADPEEQRIQKRQKEIRGLLNKVTPSTFADLWTEFRDQKVHEDESLLPIVIDLIFDKAVEEPNFCSIYSDLCKNQVDHEAHLQVAAKPFRQGIIKKAQATFEGANQVKETMKELEQELEAETDEEKKQEKATNLEAVRTKEKRRLRGTIRFIAELYRHFLITDTIIQWCSVHLIKTYDETQDDVYIEYAAHMIERVGPAFEARKQRTQAQAPNPSSVNLIEQVMNHFMQIKDTLSNRVRFMILDLDELRQGGWKSKRFAREQGPKTIQEVHQEAKEEEIQNRFERDAYERNKHMEQQRGGGSGYGQRNKQGYGGRPSNDYRQQQPRAPDDRRSQAAAAANSSGSGLRKDMSLKQADNQPDKLGVKSGWVKGAGGGGQSSFFSKQQQKKPDASRPAPARSGQEAPNRDGSQPGSREQSESRGGPKSADRKASLASKGGSEDRSSTPDQSSTGGVDGARGSPAPVQSPPPPPVDEKKVAGAVRATIDEYSMDVVSIDEAFDAVNELCQRNSVQVVFKKFFAYGGEQVKPSDDDMRRYIGQIICKCLQAESLKEDAIKGFAQYCTEAVEQELSYDCPGLWKNIARIIGWSMFCHVDNVEGPRPHMNSFTPVFKAANEQSPQEFSVLIHVLQMMVEEIGNHEGMSEDEVVSSFEMTFDELLKADPAFYDSDDFKDALKKAECKLAAHPNLYSLLKPS